MNYTLPASKDESWKKTNPGVFTFPEDIPQRSLSAFSSEVFHQGGVRVMRLKEALGRVPHIIEGCERREFANDLARFACLNANDGYIVVIDHESELEAPVSIFSELSPGGHAVLKNLIVVSPRSKVTLVEHIDDSRGVQGLFSTHIIMGSGARLDYRRYWKWNRPVYADVFFQLSENAELKLTTYADILMTGKIEQKTALKEPGGFIDEYFVDVAKGKAHVDFQSHIEHSAPHTTSRLEARAVVYDRAYSLHHGLITIERSAGGADSYFSSRNLLLSKDGRADSIPKLEIRTDEVKAGHGVTASDVDAEAIYYLMTRGLGRVEAEELYVEGFVEEIYRRFPELENVRRKDHVA